MVYLKNLKRPNHFNYNLLHICFDSFSGAKLKVSLLFAQENPLAIP